MTEPDSNEGWANANCAPATIRKVSIIRGQTRIVLFLTGFASLASNLSRNR
jgi:hypothetical protein